MTVLPIVERELRTAARRGGTYWNRLLVALVAVLLACSIFVVELGASTQQIGQFIFRGLAGLLLLYCLVQGRRASADCLSEEKREGTLGLLFLTDLKGHDVVLGKLVATSLGGFYALVAVFPVLALTFLLGGVGSGEFWRMVLVLINAFLFSLAVGVMSSSLSRDLRRAMAANFFLLLCLAAVPPACASVIAYWSPTNRFPPSLLYSCPVYTFWMSFDLNYKGRAWDFWWSLGVIHALVWLLVGLASWVVPHTWQDRPSRAGRNLWREFWHWLSYGKGSKQLEHRRRLLEVNAFYWLAGRARLKTLHVWVFLGFMGLWWVCGWIASRSLWFDASVAITMALLLNTTLKVWVVIEAGQRLAEDQQAGALELMLSTSLGVPEILRGQWLALCRQFLGPLLAVLGVETLWMLFLAMHAHDDGLIVIWLAGMLMLVADMIALGWVAMRAALTAQNHNRATITAFTRILVVPWIGYGLVWAFGNAWCFLTSDNGWNPSAMVYLSLWLGWGLGADLLFGLLAWRQLHTRFRQYVVQRYAPAQSRLSRWFRRARTAGQAPRPAPAGSGPRQPRRPWGRKTVVAAVVLALVAAGWVASRWRSQPAYPPPVRVALTSSHTPISISFLWGQAMVIVLPDGTLWRWSRTGPVDPQHPALPKPIGTNRGWWKVTTASSGRWIALRQDGSLWEGQNSGATIDDPVTPLATGHDWVDVASANAQTAAIRRDGTLWTWNNTLKAGAIAPPRLSESLTNSARGAADRSAAGASNRVAFGTRRGFASTGSTREPTQIGTNHNWTALRTSGSALVALRKDGTLWAWDQLRPTSGRPGWFTNAPVPIQVCSDTNWVALAGMNWGGVVWNQAGELWDPFCAPPNAEAPAMLVGRLVASNSAPRHAAVAYYGSGLESFQIRTNGTLWSRPFPDPAWSGPTNLEWSRIGVRTDWVSLWSTGLVAFGLTADGTLWTWGMDFTRDATLDLATRLRIARTRLAVIFGAGRARAALGFGFSPAYVKDPRPLFMLEPAPRERDGGD